MWMMGYSDGGGEINTIQDPFTGRKLRPLMPRPASAAAATPCLTRFHGTDLFALNHHLAMVEQNKRDVNTQQVVVSSRWNPTTEQLQTLEELYRRGTRTPSAEQIQQITAQLRRYGKIEGKNVFYWFQNHKARERQKRRRQLEYFPDRDEHHPHSCSNHDNNNNNNNNGDTRSEGANRTLFEVEQTKNWASPTNSSTPPQKSGEAEAECKADDGWVQFDDDAELQRRRNATWQMMNLSSSSSSSPTNPIPTSSTVTIPAIPSTPTTLQQFNPQDFINTLLEPYNSLNPPHRSPSPSAAAQTLELFPVQSRRRRPNDHQERRCRDHNEDEDEDEDEEEEDSRVSVNNNNIINNINASHVTPYQFFEFLPLKN